MQALDFLRDLPSFVCSCASSISKGKVSTWQAQFYIYIYIRRFFYQQIARFFDPMAWEILYTKLIRKIGLFKLLLMVIFLFWGTHGIGKGLAMCLLVYCVCVSWRPPHSPPGQCSSQSSVPKGCTHPSSRQVQGSPQSR